MKFKDKVVFAKQNKVDVNAVGVILQIVYLDISTKIAKELDFTTQVTTSIYKGNCQTAEQAKEWEKLVLATITRNSVSSNTEIAKGNTYYLKIVNPNFTVTTLRNNLLHYCTIGDIDQFVKEYNSYLESNPNGSLDDFDENNVTLLFTAIDFQMVRHNYTKINLFKENMVLLLVHKYSANVNRPMANYAKSTPLHHATWIGNLEICKVIKTYSTLHTIVVQCVETTYVMFNFT